MRTADTLFCTKRLATYTGLSPSFFEKLRCYGGGPPFYRIGRGVRYKIKDVDAWLELKRCDARFSACAP